VDQAGIAGQQAAPLVGQANLRRPNLEQLVQMRGGHERIRQQRATRERQRCHDPAVDLGQDEPACGNALSVELGQLLERCCVADAAPLLFVECRAPARVLAERAALRDRQPRRVSDASLSVVVRESSTWEPLDEVPPEAHVTLRSDRPVEAQLADLLALLDRRIGQPTTRPSDATQACVAGSSIAVYAKIKQARIELFGKELCDSATYPACAAAMSSAAGAARNPATTHHYPPRPRPHAATATNIAPALHARAELSASGPGSEETTRERRIFALAKAPCAGPFISAVPRKLRGGLHAGCAARTPTEHRGSRSCRSPSWRASRITPAVCNGSVDEIPNEIPTLAGD